MNPLIGFVYMSFLIGSFSDYMNLTKVKIEFSELAEIEQLVHLGLKAEGYILNNKYWLVDLSNQELTILKRSPFDYEMVESDSEMGLEQHVSYLEGEMNYSFDSCGYQLSLSYNASKKLNNLVIQVFDLEGKQYLKRLGYNIPIDTYHSKFSTHTWPNGIYLVQLEPHDKEIIQKVIQKNVLED